MRAISSFCFETGILVTSASAVLALRIRVSMSAMGSVFMRSPLPARLRHAGDDARVGEIPQADAAQAELPVHGTRAAALLTARVAADLVLGRPGGLDLQRFLRHCSALPEWHAELPQELACLVVGMRGGRDRHVQPAYLVDSVVVDLREDDLLPDAEGEVPPAVERVGVDSSEVANPRQ